MSVDTMDNRQLARTYYTLDLTTENKSDDELISEWRQAKSLRAEMLRRGFW